MSSENPHLQRGVLLFEQSRYEQAEAEFRQAIAADPQNAYARAILALTLSERERYEEAEAELSQGLQLDPGDPFLHYARARILLDRQRLPEAQKAITEAIELDPEDADYRGLQAQIYLEQKNWTAALEAAENGLSLDPEHVSCTNLRAMALVKLGRKEEAGATIDAALARDPEDSVTHANQGWTLLHSGEHQKALDHFRESLRLDPENEWARQGTVEALKARYVTYALMLKYFLWMSRLSDKAQWLVVIGGYIGMRMLRKTADQNPELMPFVFPLQMLFLIFVFLTWTADPLFNLLLRLNKYGRMVLTREETIASSWVGGFVGMALVCLVLGLSVYKPALVGALVFGFGVLPLAGIFKCQPGWPKFAMTAYTIAIVGAGVLVVSSMVFGFQFGLAEENFKGARAALIGVFFLGILASGWVANILMMQRVRK